MPARIIFTHARSGSTSLARAIAQASETSMAYEPFGKAMRETRGIEPETAEFRDYVAEIAEEHDAIKHLWRVFTPEQNRALLTHPSYRDVLFLYRKNTVAASISQMIAFQTKEWGKASSKKPLKAIRVSTLRKMADELGEQIASYEKMARASSNVVMSVSYEEIYSSQLSVPEKSRVLARICEALQLPASDDALLEAAEQNLMPEDRYNGPERYATLPNAAEIFAAFGDQILEEV